MVVRMTWAHKVAGSNPVFPTMQGRATVACQSHKLKVGGSNPPSAPKFIISETNSEEAQKKRKIAYDTTRGN